MGKEKKVLLEVMEYFNSIVERIVGYYWYILSVLGG